MEARSTQRRVQSATALPHLNHDATPNAPLMQEQRPMATTTLTKKKTSTQTSELRRADQATATLKRALEIADKGMFKEAILLWEHATRLGSDTPIPMDTLLIWMINAQQHNKAIRFFTTHEAALQYSHPQLWTTSRELFALFSLLTDPESHPLPPWNAPPWNHSASARNALIAYSRGEVLAMRAYLTPIGTDSPFHPFRRILESLLLPSKEREKITALLHNIADTSPFAPLAAIARTRILPANELAQALLNLSPVARIPATMLCGVEEKHLKLLLKMEQAKTASQQITLLLTHADQLPLEATRNACLNLLPDCMEERGRFEKRFGSLEEFQRERLFALHHERQKSFSRAMTYWRKCLLLLENAPDTEENRLNIALLYQHLATIEQRYANPSTIQILDHLKNSLTFDPANQKTWLEMLNWRNRLKRDRHLFHQLADKAAKLFPKEEEILAFALTAAMEKGAYKKASVLARRIQKQNPNHASILETRLMTHLHHIRKRIGEGHFELARKELQRAENILFETSQPLCLLGAMLEFLEGNLQQGELYLEKGRELAQQRILYAVEAFHEAVKLKVPPLILDRFRRDLIQCDGTQPNREEIILIAEMVTNAHSRYGETARETMALLSGHYRKAAVLVYTLEEMRKVCEALAITHRYPLLALYGKIAETRWPQEPIFTYFRACGQCEAQAWRLTDTDFHALFQAAEELKGQDLEGATLINTLLAIPPSQRPTGLWHSIPLSPVKIPKPLEAKLLKELRSRLQEEFQANQDATAANALKKRLIETLASTEFGQRGPLVLGYLIDRAFKSKKSTESSSTHPFGSNQQLEMDLFYE